MTRRSRARSLGPVLGALVALLLLCADATALAEARREGRGKRGAAGALERGRQVMRNQEYYRAVEELQLVAGNDRAAAQDRVEAFEILGVLHTNNERVGSATRAFRKLLSLDPGHRLADDPAITARAREVFGKVREGFRPEVDTTLEVRTPEHVPESGSVRFEASLGGRVEGVHEVVLFVRLDGDTGFSRVPMHRDHRECSAEAPNPGEGVGLQYYVEAAAPSGHLLASFGTVSAPARVPPAEAEAEPEPEPEPALEPDPYAEPEPEPDPEDDLGPGRAEPGAGRWYSSWWFWTIVGAVVAGGATTAIVLSLPGEGYGETSLGSLDLR